MWRYSISFHVNGFFCARKDQKYTSRFFVRLWRAVAPHLTLLNEFHLLPVAERTRQVFVRVRSMSSPRPLNLANSDAIRTFWSVYVWSARLKTEHPVYALW
jgi:hypothetical protein